VGCRLVFRNEIGLPPLMDRALREHEEGPGEIHSRGKKKGGGVLREARKAFREGRHVISIFYKELSRFLQGGGKGANEDQYSEKVGAPGGGSHLTNKKEEGGEDMMISFQVGGGIFAASWVQRARG